MIDEITTDKKKNITTLVVIVLIILAFFIGLAIGLISKLDQDLAFEYGDVEVTDVPSYLGNDVNFDLFWQVWNIAKQKYLHKDEIHDIDLFYGSLAGSVAALGDPYSVFFNPEVADKFTEELSGRFEGIGAEIGIKQNRLTIIAPLPDTPADKAGIRAGDKILAIDGLDTTGMSTDRAVNLIRGEGGTEVVLTILHKTDTEAIEIPIIRDTIKILSVQSEVKENNVGYIRITHFNEDTSKRFKTEITNLLDQNIDKLVVDLRNDPGGFLDVAIQIAGYWIDNDVVVKESFYDESKNHDYRSSGRAVLADIPTVVIVNGGSASASEILAGALQDYGLATIIGEQTFGKGSVQELESLSDGSAIKITVAEWLTPKGRAINEVGIEPDQIVEFDEEVYNNDGDNQLDEALRIINELE
ncbi:MAG: S41 family peptidase [Candidatus Komeilibacteria bacterium]